MKKYIIQKLSRLVDQVYTLYKGIPKILNQKFTRVIPARVEEKKTKKKQWCCIYEAAKAIYSKNL